MGKTQSKRSVDITTEVKKDDVPEEGTGKMGKIEDVDQLKPQVNGDTNHSESEVGDKEKSADTEGTENEKDLSTEKEQQATEPKANLEGGDESKAATATTPTDDKPVENGNGNDDTLNESKNASETTNENGDSSKKPKKEKVKKKWSLRSISFGKKDKQKPPKKEETTTNGECEKVPEEGAEEPTKNGDATAEENAAANGSSDEKSPVTSPATESKDLTTPAAEATTPATESTPIVNGSTEPAKDEKPVAEVAPTVVTEDKSPEPVAAEKAVPAVEAAEEPPKVDADPEPVSAPVAESAPAVVAIECAKTEIVVPTKIEVKAENVQDETIQSQSEAATSAAVASDEPQQGDIKEDKKIDDELNIKNIGGDSESAQNLPPPPLPCTSPPSQVSVFALSDDSNKENSGNEQESVPSTVEPVEKSVEIETPVKEVEPVTESQNVVESIVAQETEGTVAKLIEPDLETVTPENKTDEQKKIENSVEEENKPAVEENLISQDEPSQQDPAPVILSDPTPVNSEQIAQTIALIDEVTQEAAIAVNSQIEEKITADVPVESVAIESEVKQTSDENQITEELLPTETPLSGELKSEEPELIPSHQEIEESTANHDEKSVAAQLVSEKIEEKPESLLAPKELIGDHENLTQDVETNATSIVVKDEEACNLSEETSKDPIATLNETELPAVLPTSNTTETEDATQLAKLKENGFGENHETSATESLNGDHKTIEEIKSDCSEKLATEPTTEVAAGAIEVKE